MTVSLRDLMYFIFAFSDSSLVSYSFAFSAFSVNSRINIVLFGFSLRVWSEFVNSRLNHKMLSKSCLLVRGALNGHNRAETVTHISSCCLLFSWWNYFFLKGSRDEANHNRALYWIPKLMHNSLKLCKLFNLHV